MQEHPTPANEESSHLPAIVRPATEPLARAPRDLERAAPEEAKGGPSGQLPPPAEHPSAVRTFAESQWSARRTELATLVLALLIYLAMVPQVLNFERRNEAQRHVLQGLPFWKTLEALEFRLYDNRFVRRGIVRPRCYDKIAVVAIDANSLRVLNQWPWPRRYHAQLIRRLKKAGARVIALDIGFDSYQDPQRGPHGEITLSPDDQALATAMHEAGNVILAASIDTENTDIDAPHAGTQMGSDVVALAAPVDPLDAQTPDLGLAYVPRDSDGTVRRSLLACRKPPEPEPIGGFAALAAGMFQGLIQGERRSAYTTALAAGLWPDLDGVSHAVPLSEAVLGDPDEPEADKTRLWTTPLNYWGPPGSFETAGYSDVLGFASLDQATGKMAPGGYSDAELRRRFEGRIVFVGATAHILKDLFPAPLFWDKGKAVESQISGVELHATLCAMLLDGVYIHTVSTQGTLLTMLLLTVAASVWTVGVRGWVTNRARGAQFGWAKLHHVTRQTPGRVFAVVWFALYMLLAAVPLVAFWSVAVWFFIHRSLWVVVAYPALSGALSSAVGLLVMFGAEQAERRKTITQMGRFFSAAILEEILAHPEADYPRPHRMHATVLFTDLQGFTSYSESHDPEDVVSALNDYITRMVPIVETYGGSVDKYIGDAIMASFGVPVPYYDHAARALLCAVEMQEACARFRAETGIEFYMRVGIHTGEIIGGCMGNVRQDREHLNFTVIGDTVNLASRLEGKNKEFGSWIMCSSDTYAAAPGVVVAESASAQIKGKSQAVDVYIVHGLPNSEVSDKNWGEPAAGTQEKLEDEGMEELTEPGAATTPAPAAQAEVLRALPEGKPATLPAQPDGPG